MAQNERRNQVEHFTSRIKHTVAPHAVTAAAVVFWLITIYHLHTQSISRARYGILFLGLALLIYIINELTEEQQHRFETPVLISCVAILSATSYHFFTDFDAAYTIRSGWALNYEYILSALFVGVILYLTWREFGNIFTGLLSGSILYARFGYLIPGFFSHAGVGHEFILRTLVTDISGFYGSITQITAAWIAPFLLFGGLLLSYGAFDLILRIAVQSSKYIRSGVAQTAVISSAIIGSINGSYAANAGMTGSVTIPTMTDSGMKPENAAGIEAVASTSGQVLPPVMGAAAFVMASLLGIQYVDVLVSGLLPAAIFVTCIALGVHYTAIRDTGRQKLEFKEFFDEPLTNAEILAEGVKFGLPVTVLIYYLGIAQYTVMTSALITIIIMIALGILMPVFQECYHAIQDGDTQLLSQGQKRTKTNNAEKSGGDTGCGEMNTPIGAFRRGITETVLGFRKGAIILAPIAIIIAAINGVVDLFMITGIPSALALALIELSAGILIIAILLAMFICIISGVGMPTVAAYVVVSILVAPTLISDFGINEITAHYMVFYATILAGITPPVAPAAIITSGIAKADFWRTCSSALRIAAPLFILPISFIYHPEIVSPTITLKSVYESAVILTGGIIMIIGLNSPFNIPHPLREATRGVLFVLGVFTMVSPAATVQFGSVVISLAIIAVTRMLYREN